MALWRGISFWAVIVLLAACAATLVGHSVEHNAQAGLPLPRRVVLERAPALRELPRGRGPLATKLNHKIIRQWLEHYHSRHGDHTANSTHGSRVPGGIGQLGSDSSSSRYISAEEMRRSEEQQNQKQEELLQGAGNEAQPRACQLAAGRGVMPGQPRPNLVLVPAGDAFNASKWMSHPQLANFDLVVLYYGTNASYQCTVCKKVFHAAPGTQRKLAYSLFIDAVFHAPGTKWKLVYSLYTMRHWRQLTQGYRAIMVADDDLAMDTCVISRTFDVFHEYGLLMAQPSICRRPGVHSNWELLYQRPSFALRFTTFVEIMAPIFDVDLYNGLIAPSCYNAHFGWALDFVWPFLLRYPKDKIAVIDEVCMGHPPSDSKQGASLYVAPAPFSASEEGQRREREFGYVPWKLQQLGYPFHAVQELGGVLRPNGESPAANRSTETGTQPGPWHSGGNEGREEAQVHDVGVPAPTEGKSDAAVSAEGAGESGTRAEVPPVSSSNSGGGDSSSTGRGSGSTGGGSRGATKGGSLSISNSSIGQQRADQASVVATGGIQRPGWDDLEQELLRQISQADVADLGAEGIRTRLLTQDGLPRVGLLWQGVLVTACVVGAWVWQRGRGPAAAAAREDEGMPTPSGLTSNKALG